MLRSLLVGLLATSAMSACGKAAAPAAQPGAIAGNVVEVTGEVQVIHAGGTAPAPLTKGATVAADDEIITGADGRVAIVLAHNNARWDVKPGTRKKVSESAAWGLAKVDQTAEIVDHATSAAGRDQERAGADTSATAATHGGAMPMAPPVAASPPPPAEVAAGSAAAPTPALEQQRRRAAGETRASAGEEAKETTVASATREADVPRVEAAKAQAKTAQGDSVDKADRAVRGMVGADALAAEGEAQHQEVAPPGGSGGGADGAKNRKGTGADPGVLRAAIAPRIGALTACLEPRSTHELTITVAKGKISFVLGGKSNAQTRGCIGKIVASLKVTTDGSQTLVLEHH